MKFLRNLASAFFTFPNFIVLWLFYLARKSFNSGLITEACVFTSSAFVILVLAFLSEEMLKELRKFSVIEKENK